MKDFVTNLREPQFDNRTGIVKRYWLGIGISGSQAFIAVLDSPHKNAIYWHVNFKQYESNNNFKNLRQIEYSPGLERFDHSQVSGSLIMQNNYSVSGSMLLEARKIVENAFRTAQGIN